MPSASQFPIVIFMSQPPFHDPSPSKKRRSTNPQSQGSDPGSHGSVEPAAAPPHTSSTDKMSLLGLLNAGQSNVSLEPPVVALDTMSPSPARRRGQFSVGAPLDISTAVDATTGRTNEQSHHQPLLQDPNVTGSRSLQRTQHSYFPALPSLSIPPPSLEPGFLPMLAGEPHLYQPPPLPPDQLFPSRHRQGDVERFQSPISHHQHVSARGDFVQSEGPKSVRGPIGEYHGSREHRGVSNVYPHQVPPLPGLPSIRELASGTIPAEGRSMISRGDIMRQQRVHEPLGSDRRQYAQVYGSENRGGGPSSYIHHAFSGSPGETTSPASLGEQLSASGYMGVASVPAVIPSSAGPSENVEEPRQLSSSHMCGACGKEFRTKQGYLRHNQTVHLKIRPYECTQCGAMFGQKCSLQRHQKAVHHDVEIRWRCEHRGCAWEFSEYRLLQAHIKSFHCGEPPYVCGVSGCSASFMWASSHSNHMRTMHSEEERGGSASRAPPDSHAGPIHDRGP